MYFGSLNSLSFWALSSYPPSKWAFSSFISAFRLHYVLVLKVKVKWSRYRLGVAQRVGRGIALLFHDCGTRRGWVVSSMPRPHFTPGKEPVPILQEAGWTPGPVWTGGKSRPYQDSIPDRPARSSVAVLTELPGPRVLVLEMYIRKSFEFRHLTQSFISFARMSYRGCSLSWFASRDKSRLIQEHFHVFFLVSLDQWFPTFFHLRTPWQPIFVYCTLIISKMFVSNRVAVISGLSPRDSCHEDAQYIMFFTQFYNHFN